MHVEELFRFWDRIRKGTLELINKFDAAELDYAAYQDGFSVRQLVLHIAQEEYGEIQYGLTRSLQAFPPPYPAEAYPTTAALIDQLTSVHRDTLIYLDYLTDEELAGEVEAGWGGVYPLLDIILHVIEHEIHHRGELSLIHGLLGREGLDA